MTKLTAETITDDQIRNLRDGARGLADPIIRELCRLALQNGLPKINPPTHPVCQACGWRKGGADSWDGHRCKCGLSTLPWHLCDVCHGLGTLPYNIGATPCTSCDGSGLVDPVQRVIARVHLAAILNETPEAT